MVSRTRMDTSMTKKSTRTLPRLAAVTSPQLETKNEAAAPLKKELPRINKATPRLAPELIPKTKGPARGFLNKVCINNPETPNPLPTITAVMAFGNR